MADPSGSSGPGKYIAIAVALCCGALLFVAGIGFGVWFALNFRIVPKGDLEDMIAKTLGEGASLDGVLPGAQDGGAVDVQKLLEQVQKAAAASDAASDWTVSKGAAEKPAEGPFTFKFTPGERLHYTLTADVQGHGLELLAPEPVALKMDSAFNLVTESVDTAGNGVLELAFEHTEMKGDFMGAPFEMMQGPAGERVDTGGPDTGLQRDMLWRIPQLQFFKTPMRMKVAPNGMVTDLAGRQGAEAAVSPLPMLTDIEFPSAQLDPGAQWDSHIDMSVPGFGAPVRVRIVNTFTGYKTIGRRVCAVIEQDLTSEETNGTLTTPAGPLGGLIGFTMPEFKLGGKNMVYFDTENGQLVHSEMDLDLGLDIGQALGETTRNQLEQLGTNLGDLLSDLPEFEHLGSGAGGKPKNLLELNVDINAAVSLTDPIAPGAP